MSELTISEHHTVSHKLGYLLANIGILTETRLFVQSVSGTRLGNDTAYLIESGPNVIKLFTDVSYDFSQ